VRAAQACYGKRKIVSSNSNLNRLAERYVASWNERDPGIRRKLIDELWAEDGSYCNRLFVVSGRDMIDAVVSTAHNEYSAKGFAFKSQNNAHGNHNGVKFGWVMVTATTGEVDTFGEEFLILNDEGQIVLDYQFGIRPPSI
jgi:hypothetical protein